ncbi:MAG: hypothetical protein NVS9B15_22640 [Acidobacteriaceae bacterium]
MAKAIQRSSCSSANTPLPGYQQHNLGATFFADTFLVREGWAIQRRAHAHFPERDRRSRISASNPLCAILTHSPLRLTAVAYSDIYTNVPCQGCGIVRPTIFLSFSEQMSFVYSLRDGVEGYLCRDCSAYYARTFSLTTLFLGWFGVVAMIRTPYILFRNMQQYQASFALPPGPRAGNLWRFARTRRRTRRSLRFKLIFGIVIYSVLGYMAVREDGIDRPQSAPSVTVTTNP